ncbi:cAMP/cGMP-dependent 3',5'-cAMP/cGMP phosphodiesterase A [Gossypium arboreum]|uniref:cAMP/cGMP-dependent 3',5'-cAMP/cGMP phosphodiesterase A n=1 Tax=Gossypium arboreum TaxID=29729 RepID=A0A0B0N5V7_GOSAR|nr:cAMP/cGMP-dependent 3',5'-cAMP/cGMP phosphodiesterase A [Gossypium arboreum]
MVLHVNLKSMPTSETWSYMKSHIEILCHDICILTIPMVCTGFLDFVTLSKLFQFCIFSFYNHSSQLNII